MKARFGRAVLGGFVGTLLITAMMYLVAPMMLGKPMDIASMLGTLVGAGAAFGMVWHFVNGSLIFPAVYVAIHPGLPGQPWLRGTLFGIALWVLAQTIVMPMMGAGFFSANVGGAMAAMGSLIGHLLYGAALGAIAGGGRHEPVRQERRHVGRPSEAYQ